MYVTHQVDAMVLVLSSPPPAPLLLFESSSFFLNRQNTPFVIAPTAAPPTAIHGRASSTIIAGDGPSMRCALVEASFFFEDDVDLLGLALYSLYSFGLSIAGVWKLEIGASSTFFASSAFFFVDSLESPDSFLKTDENRSSKNATMRSKTFLSSVVVFGGMSEGGMIQQQRVII